MIDLRRVQYGLLWWFVHKHCHRPRWNCMLRHEFYQNGTEQFVWLAWLHIFRYVLEFKSLQSVSVLNRSIFHISNFMQFLGWDYLMIVSLQFRNRFADNCVTGKLCENLTVHNLCGSGLVWFTVPTRVGFSYEFIGWGSELECCRH